ncbi:MAG: hypothetical protein GX256_00295 [Fretibacterium sp.]|nr:hypothetical protein [Fretibacterium sp.]
MKHLKKLSLAALFVLVLSGVASAFFGPKIGEIDQATFKEKLGQPGVIVVDVRPEEVYNGKAPREGIPGGHIPGTINFPLAKLKEEGAAEALTAAGIVKDVEVIVYCNSGKQSNEFAEALVKDFSFEAEKVTNYKGGVIDWSKTADNKLEPEGHDK